jgi:hypothetical protein
MGELREEAKRLLDRIKEHNIFFAIHGDGEAFLAVEDYDGKPRPMPFRVSRELQDRIQHALRHNIRRVFNADQLMAQLKETLHRLVRDEYYRFHGDPARDDSWTEYSVYQTVIPIGGNEVPTRGLSGSGRGST